jgi:hypothetical protein
MDEILLWMWKMRNTGRIVVGSFKWAGINQKKYSELFLEKRVSESVE